MCSMSTKMALPPGEYDVKLGDSYKNGGRDRETLHTLRYDFKPPSTSDHSNNAFLACTTSSDITIALTDADAEIAHLFKGGQTAGKPDKTALLIIDNDTGELSLHKINTELQVKQSRDHKSKEEGTADPIMKHIREEVHRLCEVASAKIVQSPKPVVQPPKPDARAPAEELSSGEEDMIDVPIEQPVGPPERDDEDDSSSASSSDGDDDSDDDGGETVPANSAPHPPPSRSTVLEDDLALSEDSD